MLVFICLLWRLFHATLGGPIQRATWLEDMNPVHGAQDAAQDGAQDGAPDSTYRLPVSLHAPGPLIRPEIFLPVPRKMPLPTGLTPLLFPTTTQHQTGQGTDQGAVTVWCGDGTISVRLDRLQLRTWTDPSLFRLGSCEVSIISPRFLFFKYGLTECNGETKESGGRLVYSYSLKYTPPPQGYVIRVLPLDLPIHCQYERFHYSYQVGYRPQVLQKTFMKNIRSKRIFRVTVCNAQWEPLPPGHWFILGEPVYFVVKTGALLNGERLYVDLCYASSSKDPNSMPKVDIITNYGCMADSRREGSSSRFLSSGDGSLRFSVDSFLFKDSEVQYLHCSVSVGLAPSYNAKSCNYNKAAGRWEELEASPSVCSCCDSMCGDKEDSIKDTVSSPGWFIGHKGEEKPKMTVVVDQEEKKKDRMDVRLKEVQTFPRETKISRKFKDIEILAEKEERNRAAVRKWKKKENEDGETKTVIIGKSKEPTADSTVMSDESRTNGKEAAPVREEVPYPKNDSVIVLFSSGNTSEISFSDTRKSVHNASNHNSTEDVSTTIPICPNGDKTSCSAAIGAVQHEKSSSGGVRRGPVFIAVSEDSFSPYNDVRTTSTTTRLSSVQDPDADDGPFSWETLAGIHSNFEINSPGFPRVIKLRKSKLELDDFDTVLSSEQSNSVKRSADTTSDETLGRAVGSVNDKGSDGEHLEHIRGSESDRSAYSPVCRDLICADGLLGKSDFDPGSDKRETLRLNRFTGNVKAEKVVVSGTTRTHSIGSELMHQDVPGHSAVVTITTSLQDPERGQITGKTWAELVPEWGLPSLGFVVEQPNVMEQKWRQMLVDR